jgi:hypothetical protein
MTHDLSGFRPSKIWKRMPAERRLTAARIFWEDDESTEPQAEAIAAIAAHMKFRTKTLFGLSHERKSKYLATLPVVSDSIAARVLVGYHLSLHRPMMSAFLDSLGIAHENGLISDDALSKPESEKLRTAAAGLAATFPADDVALYFSTLISQDPDTWGDLAEAPQLPAI